MSRNSHLEQIQQQLDDRRALLRNLSGTRLAEVQGQIAKFEADLAAARAPQGGGQ